MLNANPYPIDGDQFRAVLRVIDPGANGFLFCAWDDTKDERKAQGLRPRPFRKKLGDVDTALTVLERWNRERFGVGVTVNAMHGFEKGIAHVERIRACFGEFDRDPVKPFPLEPSFIVHTSPGKFHAWWLVEGMTLTQFRQVQEVLVDEYGADDAAKDAARVLRLAGTWHMKGEPHPVTLEIGSLQRYTAEDLLTAFCPESPENPAPAPPEAPVTADPPSTAEPAPQEGFDRGRIFQALGYVPAAERHIWLTVGMSLHFASGGSEEGLELWSAWAPNAPDKFDEADQRRVWDSFKGRGVTLGTLFHLAKKGGWPGDKASAFDQIEAPEVSTGSLLKHPRDIVFAEHAHRQANALVKGLLLPGDTAIAYGASGSGKTFVALDLVWHVAHGREWHGRKVKRSAVLYVCLEGVHGFDLRTLAACHVHGDPGDWFARLAVHVSLIKTEDGRKGMAMIMAAARELAAKCGQPVGLIIIDTLARAIAGDNENDTQDIMSFVEHRAAALGRETGAAVMIIDHTNREGDLRGSLHKRNPMDVVLRIDRDKERRSLVAEKVKDGIEGPIFDFSLNVVPLGFDDDGDPVSSCTIETMTPKARVDEVGNAVSLLEGCLEEALAERGTAVAPRGWGKNVQAVPRDVLGKLFRKRWGQSRSANFKMQKNAFAESERIRSFKIGGVEWVCLDGESTESTESTWTARTGVHGVHVL